MSNEIIGDSLLFPYSAIENTVEEVILTGTDFPNIQSLMNKYG